MKRLGGNSCVPERKGDVSAYDSNGRARRWGLLNARDREVGCGKADTRNVNLWPDDAACIVIGPSGAPSHLSDTISGFASHVGRRGVLLISLTLAAVGCDSSTSVSSVATAPDTSALAASVDETPSQAARRDNGEREALRAATDQIKKQLADTDPNDDGTRQRLLSRLLASQKEYWRRLPGVVAPVVTVRNAPASNASKRELLRLKMSDYDMKNPSRVAAWADLKRKELGQ